MKSWGPNVTYGRILGRNFDRRFCAENWPEIGANFPQKFCRIFGRKHLRSDLCRKLGRIRHIQFRRIKYSNFLQDYIKKIAEYWAFVDYCRIWQWFLLTPRFSGDNSPTRNFRTAPNTLVPHPPAHRCYKFLHCCCCIVKLLHNGWWKRTSLFTCTLFFLEREWRHEWCGGRILRIFLQPSRVMIFIQILFHNGSKFGTIFPKNWIVFVPYAASSRKRRWSLLVEELTCFFTCYYRISIMFNSSSSLDVREGWVRISPDFTHSTEDHEINGNFHFVKSSIFRLSPQKCKLLQKQNLNPNVLTGKRI